MNEMKIFESNEFGTIRTICDECGQPLFCAKDVADALGYKRSRNAVTCHVDPKDAVKHSLLTKGGKQTAFFVNESGLYALVLSSKLKSASRFMRWVTDEVLDSVTCYTTTQIAKELNRLLCCLGVQYHQSGQYLLYAPYTRQGYAKSRTFNFPRTCGILRTHTFLV